MVYPVNRASASVLEKLSKAPRIRELGLQYSSGWNETTDRKKGYFEIGTKVPESWDDVIIQGPHFTIANPMAKQPREIVRSNNDWDEIDLEAADSRFIPRTSYQPQNDRTSYDADYSKWQFEGESRSSRGFYRLAWRRMAAIASKRTLHVAALPPGPAHVHPVYSAGPFESSYQLLGQVGVLSSVVADFLIKSSGSAEIQFSLLGQLPCFDPSWHLADQLVERAVRLNCLGDPFGSLLCDGSLGSIDKLEPARKAADRRRLEVELDALAALYVGLTDDELCEIYRTQFPVLAAYERDDLYDANRRKVSGETNKLFRQRGEDLTLEERSWTHPQSKVDYVFEFPFVSYDREDDMRKAYAHFEKLQAEKI